MSSARRDRLIRATLVIGALAAISTSAPAPHERRGRTTVEFAFGEPERHVTVRANEAAHRDAQRFTITFAPLPERSRTQPQTTLRIVPDMDGVGAPELLRIGDQPPCLSCTAGSGDEDAGSEEQPRAVAGSSGPLTGTVNRGAVSFDVPLDECPDQGDCPIGFSIERIDRPGDIGISVTLEVVGLVSRDADPALVCASDRDFHPSAAVKVEPR